MTARFVILHHTTSDGEHWDFMLEEGEVLLTWQLLREPAGLSALPIPARRIGDHRKVYLDYEGPLSGDRGTVRRVESGVYEWLERTEERWRLRFQGARWCGVATLRRTASSWVLESESLSSLSR